MSVTLIDTGIDEWLVFILNAGVKEIMLKGYVSAALIFVGAGSCIAQNLKTSVYVTGLALPVFMAQDPTDPNRQFVVQQRGLIRVIQNGVVSATNAVNLTGTVSNSGGEKGLLGLAFPPNYASTGTLYVYYTTGNVATSTTSWIAKLQRNALNPAIFDPTLDPIFTIAQPFQNHNGGTLRFGPDGYLYLGLGDGGSQGDPNDRAQNLTDLLGKLLRIDPSSDAFPPNDNKDYAIPTGQPFSGTFGTLAPEIWDIGLRNPWKYTFDPVAWLGTNALIIGDVGQDSYEEIDYEPAGAGPRNYGWRRKEGYSLFTSTSGPWTTYKDPIWVYDHSEGVSITGGYIYRGTRATDYFGKYFFADYGGSRVWTLNLNLNGAGEALNAVPADVIEQTSDLSLGANGISSIDVDSNGELFFVDYGNGRILKMDPENRAWAVDYALETAYPISGQLRSFAAADSKTFSYAADFSGDTIDGDAGVLKVGFLHNRTAPSSIVVSVVAKTNQPTGHVGRIALRNWTTKRFDVIQLMNLTSVLQTFTSPSTAAANYIRSGDGRIEVGIQGTSLTFAVDPLMTTVDQIRVAVN